MRPVCPPIRHFHCQLARVPQRRNLLTLAIETSCDDTSVAVLEKHKNNTATLHFHSKITSDNRSYRGVYPIAAHESHQKNIAGLVKEALQHLPPSGSERNGKTLSIRRENGNSARKIPDFITVTRGPGMRASLITGLDTAKGLAVAWQIPLLGVNHMQAHALTPRLVAALDGASLDLASDTRNLLGNVIHSKATGDITRGTEVGRSMEASPPFPFLTLLVSGGHTMLVHSKSLCDHEILASTTDIAVGDMLDKSARDVLPSSLLETAPDVMYGRVLETFALAQSDTKSPSFGGSASQGSSESLYGWKINTPYARSGPKGARSHLQSFSFSGIGSTAKRVVDQNPEMGEGERRHLARDIMRVAFEHLVSRVLLSLEAPETKNIRTLVVSGGVASNQYLKQVFRDALDREGYEDMTLVFPPPKYCTDNAAMIAWTGLEMYEAGWRTDLSAMALRKWAIDLKADDGGILGIDGWHNVAVH
ncbi:hypothetical protein G7Y89_g14898 [Cudoniella acicularis]|uniref:N(6)-L-threonylcarbamoyladenine synthase n=1 Tax=Cudoniella acicularis TaxID=354080 RepID=A0A8H4QWC1_9HELO|nr:hypothetical protein G7Y89_g14898 [Cudoniella acicularis]